MSGNDRYVLIGMSAGALLLAFYFIVASSLGGISFAADNFAGLWYWMVPLIAGFGIQIGMFFYLREKMHKKATAHAAASTGISTTSMIACCAHHIADIAPFLGISALGLLLTKYQPTFLLAGVLSNILGIMYMTAMINAKTGKPKIKALFYTSLVLSVIFVFASYYIISNSETSGLINANKISFQTLNSNKNNVEFHVTPLSPSAFQIEINTHSVELDFDLMQISALYDDAGNLYKPLKWEGSAPGGHHRSGILKFSSINGNAKSIKLVIRDSAMREFNWSIK